MLARNLAALGLAAICVFSVGATASADDDVDIRFNGNGTNGTVTIDAEHTSSSAGAIGSNVSSSSKSGTKATCSYDGHEIDCQSSQGVWSAARQCFVQRVSPQPALDNPIWDGNTKGSIYQCTPPGAVFSAGEGRGYWFWVAEGDADATDLVDPVTLAERAVEQMELVGPEVGATPLDPDAPLLVGVDAWFWIDNNGQHSVGPITRTATAGPTTVTATARVTRTLWDLGDGTTMTCPGSGTPWTPDQGTGPSPTCGHRYEVASIGQPDGVYTVRATTHWRVDWNGAGQSGQITFTMTGSRPLEVVELQVLQTG